MYDRMVEVAKKQLIRNVAKFVKYLYWEDVTVEEDGLLATREKNVCIVKESHASCL